MDLIEKEFTWKGETSKVYFRELTAGEQLKLAQGQKYIARGGEGEMEFDMVSELRRGHMLLQMSLVDSEGKPVYRNLDKVAEENGKKVNALVKLAKEALKDSGEDDAGNA